jgi:hypothetical protein
MDFIEECFTSPCPDLEVIDNRQKDSIYDSWALVAVYNNSVDAPIDSIKWAKNLYRTRHAKPSLITRLVASLQMDLAPGKPAFGERSTSTDAARQMLFNAGEHAVELRVTSKPDKADLQGQVLGEGFAGADFALSSRDLYRKIKIGDLSEFEIADVPKGYYTLTIRSSDKEIVIEDVDI